MVVHRMFVPVTDARFSIAVTRLVVEEGPVPIPRHLRTFSNMGQGPIRTNTRNVEGFHILDMGTGTFRFQANVPGPREQEAAAEEEEEAPITEEADVGVADVDVEDLPADYEINWDLGEDDEEENENFQEQEVEEEEFNLEPEGGEDSILGVAGDDRMSPQVEDERQVVGQTLFEGI